MRLGIPFSAIKPLRAVICAIFRSGIAATFLLATTKVSFRPSHQHGSAVINKAPIDRSKRCTETPREPDKFQLHDFSSGLLCTFCVQEVEQRLYPLVAAEMVEVKSDDKNELMGKSLTNLVVYITYC